MDEHQSTSNSYKTKTEEIIRDKFPYVLVGGTILFFALLSAAVLLKPSLSENPQGNLLTKIEKFFVGEPTPAAPTPAPDVYKVASGESLASISQKIYGNEAVVPTIAAANNMQADAGLTVGQELRLPPSTVFADDGGGSGLLMIKEPTRTPEPTQKLEPTAPEQPTAAKEVAKVETTPAPQPTIAPPLASAYTVVANDNLWTISAKVYGTGYGWTEIAKANNLTNPNTINSGATLQIPALTAEKTAELKAVMLAESGQSGQITAAATTKADTSITSYKVLEGDHLWSIATHVYGDGYGWTRIAQANRVPTPNIIYPGQVLTIPR